MLIAVTQVNAPKQAIDRMVDAFRLLARDYERLHHVLVGMHFVALACLMLHRRIPDCASS